MKVGVDTMQSAILIGNYFTEHAKAAYQLMGADEQSKDARYILRQLEKRQYEQITRTDLNRLCHGRFPKGEDMDQPLSLLIEHGYLRVEKEVREGPGRRLMVYKINPQAYGINGIYAKNNPLERINGINPINPGTPESENPSGEVII